MAVLAARTQNLLLQGYKSMSEREVLITEGDLQLPGTLTIPEQAQGIVLFAHGSGSSRFSPRNRRVAAALVEAGFATVLFDLLTEQEEYVDERTRHLRFDIGLLASRLAMATSWIGMHADVAELPVGYFGASTGAAAALVAASAMPVVRAVVSRGGRPDLAGDALQAVRAATLLIVGGADPVVVDLNRSALARLQCEKRLEIVPGATHLFEESGALEVVTALAARWFRRFLDVNAAEASVAAR
jgi:dienelactone hydrolase